MFDLGVGQEVGAEGADGGHGRVEVMFFVGGPGGAGVASLK